MNFFSKYKDNPEYVTKLSRSNHLRPTEQERQLWIKISGKKLAGLKFRRQFPIGRYIVDFYNHSNRLVIEIDGPIHNVTMEYDNNRDLYLKGCGYRVLHVTNDEIDRDIESVLRKIVQFVQISPPAGDLGGACRSVAPATDRV